VGEGLESSDWRQRLLASRLLDADSFSREALLGLLDDEAAGVRRRAAYLLGNLDDPSVAPELLSLAADRDKNVRNVVRERLSGLARRHEEVVWLLLDAFASAEPRLRTAAAWVWPERCPVTPLADALGDPNATVRWAATRSLAARSARPHPEDDGVELDIELLQEIHQSWVEGKHDPTTFEHLKRAARDPAPTVRVAAFQGLHQLELDDEVLQLAARALDDEDDRVRLAAVRTLEGRVARRIVEPLRRACGDPARWVRFSAVEALLKADADAGLEAAFQALHARNRNLRIDVARRLGWHGDARAVEPLVELLTRSTAIEPKASAARALGELGDDRAVVTLAAALDDWRTDDTYAGAWAYAPVRHCAARALRAIGTPTALAALRDAGLPEDDSDSRS
jgi:HEAT repeat protein